MNLNNCIKPIKVFRIEHKIEKCHKNLNIHRGPYWDHWIWIEKMQSKELHPNHQEDEILKNIVDIKGFSIDSYYFGVESIKELGNWFNKDTRIKLSSLDFIIAEYDSIAYYKGKTQIIFIPLSNRVNTYSLNCLDE
jgi:hypothetical protein